MSKGRPKKKLFMSNSFGLRSLIENKTGGSLLKPTKRIIIIGPSGSGKSTIAQEIIFSFDARSLSEINYFLPQGNEYEKDIKVIKELCRDAFIFFNVYRYNKDSIPTIIRNNSLNIFDDAHKKHVITDMAEKLFTEGRHKQQHIIYIQQAGTFIPAGMKSSYSELIVHKSSIEDIKDYIKLKDNITLPDTDTGFYTINKNGNIYPTLMYNYKLFRDYRNRLKSISLNKEEEYKNNINKTKEIHDAYVDSGAKESKETNIVNANNDFINFIKLL